MVEWLNGGIVGCHNSEVKNWRNVGLAKWCCGRMADWLNTEVDTSGGIIKCRNSGMVVVGGKTAERWDRATVKMVRRRNRDMTGWWNGEIAGYLNGKMPRRRKAKW